MKSNDSEAIESINSIIRYLDGPELTNLPSFLKATRKCCRGYEHLATIGAISDRALFKVPKGANEDAAIYINRLAFRDFFFGHLQIGLSNILDNGNNPESIPEITDELMEDLENTFSAVKRVLATEPLRLDLKISLQDPKTIVEELLVSPTFQGIGELLFRKS